MNQESQKVLLVEDSLPDAKLMRYILAKSKGEIFELCHVESIIEAIYTLKKEVFSACLLDLHLPDSSGLDGLRKIRLAAPELPIIFLTGFDDKAMALQAMQDGAQDYLIKGQIDGNAVARSIHYGIERQKMMQALKYSEERARTIIEQTLDGIIIVDRNGEVLFINPAVEHMMRKSSQEIVGKELDFPLTAKTVELEQLGGERLTIEISTVGTKWEDQFVLLVTLRDITERLESEKRMRLAEKVLESTADGVFVMNPDGEICMVNQAFTFLTGQFIEADNPNKSLAFESFCQEKGLFQIIQESLKETGHWHGEVVNQANGGQVIPLLLTINVVKDDFGFISNYVGIFTDISDRKKYENRLRHMATHDFLTGLPNRDLFYDRLQHALSRAKRNKEQVAVMLIDLDSFKQINDAYGHASGDQVLKAVAKRMQTTIRASDTVARIGGDEFTVILEDNPDQRAGGLVAIKLLEAIAQPLVHEGQTLFLSTSIGISIYPKDGADLDTLLTHADSAMYRAKEQGNRFAFYEFSLPVIDLPEKNSSTHAGFAFDRLAEEKSPQFSTPGSRFLR